MYRSMKYHTLIYRLILIIDSLIRFTSRFVIKFRIFRNEVCTVLEISGLKILANFVNTIRSSMVCLMMTHALERPPMSPPQSKRPTQ